MYVCSIAKKDVNIGRMFSILNFRKTNAHMTNQHWIRLQYSRCYDILNIRYCVVYSQLQYMGTVPSTINVPQTWNKVGPSLDQILK